MTKTVLILGASGKIGRHSAAAFKAGGWTVRNFDRKNDDMADAAMGADVIVNGLNPPNYQNWETAIPAITNQVIAAARASGATVILPGNVYNFGAQPGIWSETTPQNATTRKGKIRIAAEKAYKDSGVATIILRAGNFVDPNGADDVMSLLLTRAIKKGRVTYPGDPNVMQAYCYLPDWAKAAVQLAEIRKSLSVFEDIPFPGHAFTINDLRAELEKQLRRKIKLTALPWWALKLASPFWGTAWEMMEMRYLWNTDHELSGTKFARILPGFKGTDMRNVMAAGLPVDVNPNQFVAGRHDAVA